MSKNIPILIPAYEPDERMIELLKTIDFDNNFIVIVDDGSGDNYKELFDSAEAMLGESGVVLHHEVNKGKGRALKTGFKYILDNMPGAIGTVTADSDGQHIAKSIEEVSAELEANPTNLILGVRSFDGEDVPWKSRFGNKLTIKIMSFVTGIKTSDTQTGLRGIPASFMSRLLNVKGDRFEFEMEMLVESAGKYPIKEVGIPTIYDSKENHQTHFRPVIDSLKVYKVFGKKILKFILSSLSSAIIDIFLFWVFCNILRTEEGVLYVTVSAVLARLISATYNYAINYIFVFKSQDGIKKTIVRYAILAAIQMAASSGITTLGVLLIPAVSETVVKIVVDSILFLISYKIQQKIVF